MTVEPLTETRARINGYPLDLDDVETWGGLHPRRNPGAIHDWLTARVVLRYCLRSAYSEGYWSEQAIRHAIRTVLDAGYKGYSEWLD